MSAESHLLEQMSEDERHTLALALHAERDRVARKVDRIVDALRAVRFNYSTEFDLHDGIEQALTRAGHEFEREVVMTARDRIDFVCERVAIEVKIDGGTASVRRQVHRYTEHDLVDAVLLVTNRVRHNGVAGETVNGKPIRVYNLLHQAVL